MAELSFDVLRGLMIVEHEPAVSDERIVETIARIGMRAELGNETTQDATRGTDILDGTAYFPITDVGVQHHDDDPGEGAPFAEPPKLRTPKPAELLEVLYFNQQNR